MAVEKNREFKAYYACSFYDSLQKLQNLDKEPRAVAKRTARVTTSDCRFEKRKFVVIM